jgi:hypothetical protein
MVDNFSSALVGVGSTTATPASPPTAVTGQASTLELARADVRGQHGSDH